jgi:hypothetical protein
MIEIETEKEFVLVFPDYPKIKPKVKGNRANVLYLADQLADVLITKVDVYRLDGNKRIYLETSYPDYYWRMV